MATPLQGADGSSEPGALGLDADTELGDVQSLGHVGKRAERTGEGYMRRVVVLMTSEVFQKGIYSRECFIIHNSMQ